MDHNRPQPGRPNMPTLPSITTLNPSLIYEYNVGNSPQSRQQNPYSYSHDPYYQPRQVKHAGPSMDAVASGARETPRRTAVEDNTEPHRPNSNSYTHYHNTGHAAHNSTILQQPVSPSQWNRNLPPTDPRPQPQQRQATNGVPQPAKSMERKRKLQDLEEPASYPQPQKHRDPVTTQQGHTVPTQHRPPKAKRHASSASASTVSEPAKRSISPCKKHPSVSKHQTWIRTTEYTGISHPIRKAEDVHVRVANNPRIKNNNCIDDHDGYYLVIPDTGLSPRYRISKLLGQGTFGKVVQATDSTSNEPVAIKIVRSVPKYREAARQELRVLRTLEANDAANRYRCLHLRDCFEYHSHICIVTDLLGPSLFDFLKNNNFAPFPFMHVQSMAKQILTSIAYVHDLGLIHTDLKPENILIRDPASRPEPFVRRVPPPASCENPEATERQVLLSTDVKLIDFGSATFQNEFHASIVSTRHYRAPEVVLGLGWSFACDIWSVGCILVELFTGANIFQTHDNIEHLAMMQVLLGEDISLDMINQFDEAWVKKKKKTTPQTPEMTGEAASPSANPFQGYFKDGKLNYPSDETPRGSKKLVKMTKPLEELVPKSNSFLAQFHDLLKRMLTLDPTCRMTAKDALAHPWFEEYDYSDQRVHELQSPRLRTDCQGEKESCIQIPASA